MLQRNREWNRQWQSVVAALSESTYLLTYGALAAATAGLGTEPGAGTPRVQHRYKPGAGTPLASFCTSLDARASPVGLPLEASRKGRRVAAPSCVQT